MSDETTELLNVGDILWNEPCDERIVVIAANERNVWLRKVQKNDELAMYDGHVWAMLGKKCNVKNMCTQSYAQSVFELDGHVEQSIAATLGRLRAKSHPYGYEPDTGAFDCTRCECGCINDISATYCNDCGGEIEIDMNAEKEIYHTPHHSVFVEKHDDGSLELGGKRYIAATPGGQPAKLTADQVRETVEKHWHDLPADYDMPEATALPEYSYDWQAIADELNAEIGGGECELEIKDNMDESEGTGAVWWECSSCHWQIEFFHTKWLEHAKFCPECGARIRKAVER